MGREQPLDLSGMNMADPAIYPSDEKGRKFRCIDRQTPEYMEMVRRARLKRDNIAPNGEDVH